MGSLPRIRGAVNSAFIFANNSYCFVQYEFKTMHNNFIHCLVIISRQILKKDDVFYWLYSLTLSMQ